MQSLEQKLQLELSQRQSQSNWRERLLLQSNQAAQVVINGRSLINFSANDYLGLASHPSTIERIKQQVETLGIGSGASHLVSGHHQVHQQLEAEVSSFLQRQATVTFSTGYMANLAILQTLAKKGDLIIADKLNHASLIDGVKLSAAEACRYAHCDLDALENRLKKTAEQKWVVTDGVFSMDGDLAPLDKIAGLCKKYQAILMVDDAHGLGVVGKNGRGSAEWFGLKQQQLPVLMGTFGKALGGFGAFVSGSQTLIDYLVQFARPYIYTTAMPAMVADANLHNLRLIKNTSTARHKLKSNIDFFRQQSGQAGLNLLPSTTAIQPILVGNSQRLMQAHQQLKAAGFLVGAIRVPTVPTNTERFRITLSASHSEQQIKQLVDQLAKVLLRERES